MFWKMGKFENLITQLIKAKFLEKKQSLPFALDISNSEITFSAQDQKKNLFFFYT